MINNSDYIRLSLELHLFFARIMKEHSLFLGIGFTKKDEQYKNIANEFQTAFNNLLNRVVNISNNCISDSFLMSQEMVTNNTLLSESKTSNLLGMEIDNTITKKEMNLKSGISIGNNQTLLIIDEINQSALPLIENLINFKNEVLNKVLECEMYTTNYPLLINHIMNEAKMYYNLLIKLSNRENIYEKEMYEQEIFWNNIMKEHAEFIRGLLDPTEVDLISMSNEFVKEYNQILGEYTNEKFNLNSISLQETVAFKDFKVAGETGILNCEVKSIIIPLLADHVVREANHFIRILKEFGESSD